MWLRFSLLMLVLASSLAGQVWPWMESAHALHDSLPVFSLARMAGDTQGNLFVALRQPGEPPVIHRYTQDLDSLSAWQLPADYSYTWNDADICGLHSGCLFICTQQDTTGSTRPFLVCFDAEGDTLWTSTPAPWGDLHNGQVAASSSGTPHTFFAAWNDSTDVVMVEVDEWDGEPVRTHRLDTIDLELKDLVYISLRYVCVVAQTVNQPNQDAYIIVVHPREGPLFTIVEDSPYDDLARGCIRVNFGPRFVWLKSVYSETYQNYVGLAECYLGDASDWSTYFTGAGAVYLTGGMLGGDGYVYIFGTHYAGEGPFIACLDPTDGAIRWQRSFDEPEISRYKDLVWTTDNHLLALRETDPGPGSQNTVVIDDIVPLCVNFSPSYGTNRLPFTMQFTSLSTGGVDSWSWDFDDDTVADTTGEVVSHTYEEAGQFGVTLTVTAGEYTRSYGVANTITVLQNEPPEIFNRVPADTVVTVPQGTQQSFSIAPYDPDSGTDVTWLVDGEPTGDTGTLLHYTFTEQRAYTVACEVTDGWSTVGTQWTVHVTSSATDDTLPVTLSMQLPNPYRAGAGISLALPQAGPVRLELFDIRGRKVRVLRSEPMQPGRYTLHWDGRDGSGHLAASGVYLLRLTTQGRTVTRRMVLLR